MKNELFLLNLIGNPIYIQLSFILEISYIFYYIVKYDLYINYYQYLLIIYKYLSN
jgi:hypothetical protein